MESHIAVFGLLVITCTIAMAFEPSPLQDFCVADYNSSVRVNGLVCMDSNLVQAEHFTHTGLRLPGNTSNPLGFSVTPVTVAQLPGLNTLGIGLVRFDYAPWGVVPLHLHPRATEVITVLQGSIQVGFVTSNPDNKLFSKVLHKGDVFVFPMGLIHFQRNAGYGNAVSVSAVSSQNPGIVIVASSVFGAVPGIDDDVLAKAFQVNKSTIDCLKAQF